MTLSTVERRPPTGLTFDSKAGTDAVTLADTGAAVEGTGPAILWAAQWRTPGTSANALRDNGAGGDRFSGHTQGRVIPAADTGISGWPTTNVLRVPAAISDPDGGNIRCSVSHADGKLPPWTVGMTRYWRVYIACTMSSTLGERDPSAHPVENQGAALGEEAGIGTWWKPETLADPPTVSLTPTNWNLSIFGRVGAADGHHREAYSGAFGDIKLIPCNTVYRVEVAWTRTDATHYTVQARRYTAADVLEADENDFWYSGGVLASRSFDLQNELTFEQFTCGSNQGNWMPIGSNAQCLQAAPAISDEDWLGPYNAATEATWDE